MPHPRIGETFISNPPCELYLEAGFRFRRGVTIAPFRIAYETFGELNADKSNAILVCHALSPSAHAAGKYAETDARPGWWDGMIGYGKPYDLSKYFVICVNLPGSCWGTTGPSSVDPRTGTRYGSRYPAVMIEDMVEAERLVLEHLGIKRLLVATGASLGGMQVLMWAALHPEMLGSIVCMASAAAVPVEGVAWHIIGRKAIEVDPHFNSGDYYEHSEPLRGLQVARMIGHMTYLSQESLERKFGRRRRHGTRQFEIDSYLEYQGKKFAQLYDANSYIRVQAAMDEMDLEEQFGSLPEAFKNFRAPALLISFDTDWLFPPGEVVKVHDGLREVGVNSTYREISSPNGHDAFLVDYDLISPPVRDFLDGLDAKL
jgi:homoserine O-acetyltransferase